MNAHTKQQQDKVFETDFIDSQKSDPPFSHLLTISPLGIYIIICIYIYISILVNFKVTEVVKVAFCGKDFCR